MDVQWTATPGQQQVVDQLQVTSRNGVLVRELEDGSLEVLTARRGALGRQCVARDGSSVLVESRPRDWRWWRGVLMCCVGVTLFGPFAFVGFALTDTPN